MASLFFVLFIFIFISICWLPSSSSAALQSPSNIWRRQLLRERRKDFVPHDIPTLNSECEYQESGEVLNWIFLKAINGGLWLNDKASLLQKILHFCEISSISTGYFSHTRLKSYFGSFPHDSQYSVIKIIFDKEKPDVKPYPIEDMGPQWARLRIRGKGLKFRLLLSISEGNHVPTPDELQSMWWYRLMTLVYRFLGWIGFEGNHPTENHMQEGHRVWVSVDVPSFYVETTLDAFIVKSNLIKTLSLGAFGTVEATSAASEAYGGTVWNTLGEKYLPSSVYSKFRTLFSEDAVNTIVEASSRTFNSGSKAVRKRFAVPSMLKLVELIGGLRIRETTLELDERFTIRLDQKYQRNSPAEFAVNTVFQVASIAAATSKKEKESIETMVSRAIEQTINGEIIKRLSPNFNSRCRVDLPFDLKSSS